jgi:mannose-6-phosphate isomerase-like protein (cupin superfamily)
MRNKKNNARREKTFQSSLVLYCLIRRKKKNEKASRFLMIEKQGEMSFPPTRFRPNENLYSALVRPMEEDLGLPAGCYFPEQELEMIPNEKQSARYPGLAKKWYLYPVDLSLAKDAMGRLGRPSKDREWWTLDQISKKAKEPNVQAIANHLRTSYPDMIRNVYSGPTMDALAAHWASRNDGGARIIRNNEIRKVLDAGSRAFNLRVADPYLPYQKQGLGFTWSFFTPKDKQDVHVHGLPAVEIYGVIEGRLQIWYKPMNERGVRVWKHKILEAGDWMEVEPLHCHFACWLGPKGVGTVIKAAASGELAGVGKLGISGKTTCQYCNVQTQCALHPRLIELIHEYQKPFDERDFKRIKALVRNTEE